MSLPKLFSEQNQIAQAALNKKIFLQGEPGSGKTTAGLARLAYLLENGIPAEQILILLPQRTLAKPYYDYISRTPLPPGGVPTIVTLGGLSQRTIQLFWPAISAEAGFAQPHQPPLFLTLETAQYYMAKVVEPFLAMGYFEQLVIDRNRLYSQLLDNLNKAALVGFAHTTLGERLKQAWNGQPQHLILFDQVQECINAFRNYCLENNLLDFSLQIELFLHYLWRSFLVRNYLQTQFRHLIYDNIEEDAPAAHDVIGEWLPVFDSALLIYDQHGGHRIFLGADPQSGLLLKEFCDEIVEFPPSLRCPPPVRQFQSAMVKAVQRRLTIEDLDGAVKTAFTHLPARFYPEMVDQVCKTVDQLVHQEKVPAGEIAILAPFVSDSLRFSLMNRLEEYQIPARSHRPSRSLYDEPAVRSLLTLAKLAHPHWKMPPTREEIRSMLVHCIEDLDLVRADLLMQMGFTSKGHSFPLRPFDEIGTDGRERITYSAGLRYSRLRDWLLNYIEQEEEQELDVFFAFLFGEVLSQPGYGFHHRLDDATVTARLIESIQKFRQVIEPIRSRQPGFSVGLEYLTMVGQGVISALYILPSEEEDAVLISPAYSFIISNRSVRFQFWLDCGNIGWWERLYQPLTHPYVLSRYWQPGRVWTDVEEYETNQQSLMRIIYGLTYRCTEHIFLCTSRINERGAEERGALLLAFQGLLRRLHQREAAHE